MPPLPKKPLVVGAITDPNALSESFVGSRVDVIELRLDALPDDGSLQDFLDRHSGQIPLLLTARHPSEGGHCDWPDRERTDLLLKLLPFADFLDLEVSQIEHVSEVLSAINPEKTNLVLSYHDFDGFDHFKTIEVLREARSLGAQIPKAAVTLEDAVDLTLFEALAADLQGSSFSLMGMGPYASASRLLAAQHGSLLNYGYLGARPTAPGQWPAKLLREALDETPILKAAP